MKTEISDILLAEIRENRREIRKIRDSIGNLKIKVAIIATVVGMVAGNAHELLRRLM